MPPQVPKLPIKTKTISPSLHPLLHSCLLAWRYAELSACNCQDRKPARHETKKKPLLMQRLFYPAYKSFYKDLSIKNYLVAALAALVISLPASLAASTELLNVSSASAFELSKNLVPISV